jgi:Transposase DDE domain group 1
MTECIPKSFAFASVGAREVVARFDGGHVVSDGGALLLGEVERRTGLLHRFAACFTDQRDPLRIEHSVEQLVKQRVYGLALGYEDLNDHERLRRDPLLAVLSGKTEPDQEPLAGKSTLNRLELTRPLADGAQRRYKKILFDPESADRLLVDLFVEAHAEPPAEIILDLDATDDPLHGQQEGRFFHGYYGHYCYLPLYIFAGDHLLCARLRTANSDGSTGAVGEVERITGQLRRHWPEVKIILRADSGFCREELMNWCEQNGVDYILGLARNRRLEAMLSEALAEAKQRHEETGQAARVFRELRYQTRESWTRERRVVGKAEHLSRGANPRFVVTSLTSEAWEARALYEELYCQRGEMENRVKEQFQLFSDRLSTHWLWSNQLRLSLSAFAYVLIDTLRRVGLPGTEMARAEANTIRLRLLKIGAIVRVSARKIWVSLANAHPAAMLFARVYASLRC